LRLEPLNVFALEGRVKALAALRRPEDARQAIDAAVKLRPRERVLFDAQGSLLFGQGDYKGAEAAFRRSIAIEPDAVFAYANLSGALLYMDRTDEALAVLQQGLQIRPNGQLYSNLGNLLFNRADYVGAAQAFQHAVSNTKGNSNMYSRWANLGDTLRWIPGRERESRDAYAEAIVQLKPILERTPNDATMQSRLGLYSARVGDKDTATRLINLALSNAPASGDVHFRAAMVFELTGKRDQALLEISRAREHGYPANLINAEPDLIGLRRDSRYHQPTPEGVK
jgi:tetratricopeptide (TPR) repeat protein